MTARAKLTPQMETYDNLGIRWHPYVMFSQTPNFHSTIVNTDAHGRRWSNSARSDQPVPIEGLAHDNVNVLIGGSTAFGVGATADGATVSSRLAHHSGEDWANFGGRAFGSAQELIFFQHHFTHLGKVRRIVLFTGVNAATLWVMNGGKPANYPPFFFQRMFENTMRTATMGWRRRLVATLLEPYTSPDFDWSRASLGDIARHLIGNEPSPPAVAAEAPRQRMSEDFDREIRLWRMLAEGLGAELIFVLQPFAYWMDKPLAPQEHELFSYLDSRTDNPFQQLASALDRNFHTWYAGMLAETCQAHGIKFVDSNPLLAERTGKEDWVFVDRVHLTDHGNEIIARAIQEAL